MIFGTALHATRRAQSVRVRHGGEGWAQTERRDEAGVGWDGNRRMHSTIGMELE
jgi:hypothetical protein